MLPRNDPDRILITFDDHRLVANAGLLLPVTLAQHLGLRELVDNHVDLGDGPGRANTGDKMMTLVVSALAGGDCIDDADVLHTGGTARTLGGTVKAPSTLGTFLRSFRWGHVRQLALFVNYSYHGFITDRDGETLALEADHRRHAEIENAIRDLKYGVGLNHLPSGRFAANAAWLAVQVIAHNLARWTARLGLGQPVVTTKTLRRRFFSMAGRLTSSARRLTLHLPQRWPWENQFSRALARLRALPLPA